MIQNYLTEIRTHEDYIELYQKTIEVIDNNIHKILADTSLSNATKKKKEKALKYQKNKCMMDIRTSEGYIRNLLDKIKGMDEYHEKYKDDYHDIEMIGDKIEELYTLNNLRITALMEDDSNDNEAELKIIKETQKSLIDQRDTLDKVINEINKSKKLSDEIFDLINKYSEKEPDEESKKTLKKCSDCIYRNWNFEYASESPCFKCGDYKKKSPFNNVHVFIEHGGFDSTITDIVENVLLPHINDYTPIPMYFNSYYEFKDEKRFEYFGSCDKYKRILVTTDGYFEKYIKDRSAESEKEALKHIWIECTIDDSIHDTEDVNPTIMDTDPKEITENDNDEDKIKRFNELTEFYKHMR